MSKKYILLPDKKIHKNKTVYRIQAIKCFSDVKEGDLGGFVESEKNLSQLGSCWIYSGAALDDCLIEGDAKIYGSSSISKRAIVKDFAEIRDSDITDSAIVKNFAKVSFFSTVAGSALVRDYSVVENVSIVTGFAVIKNMASITKTSKVCDYAIIGGNVSISQFSTISGTVIIDDFCTVDYGIIKDNVTLSGKVSVIGATVYGNAFIKGVVSIKKDTNKSFNFKETETIKEELDPKTKKLFSDEIKSCISKSDNKYGNGI